MPNLVSVTIRGNDETGPAFASVLTRAALLRKALADTGKIGIVPDVSKIDSSLAYLKAKIQSLGIADLADVNVQPGQVMYQLQFLRRMIEQQKISDLLDINLNKSDLATQLASIGDMTATIPVNFDIGKIPRLGPTQDITDKFTIQGLEAAQQQLIATNEMSGKLDETLLALKASADSAGGDKGGGGGGMWGLAAAAAGGWGWFGLLAGHVQLFGGALTAVGLPAILGAATGMHILVDSLIETAAVIVPAGIAFAAFGVAAIPTVQDLTTAMKASYTTSQAFGQNIYPLTGGFQKMANAVQPEVYQLFGEMLVVLGHDTGMLTQVAVAAGHALDDLGARAAGALTSGGMGTFLRQGPEDLAKIGDIIGNIFGTIGNLLRVMPGYAEMLLGVLDAVTRGIEDLTGSPIGQWAAKVFLAFHGFILWGGLAATGAVKLGDVLVGLAARFGLAESGALSFDAAQFGQGIKMMAGGVLNLGSALIALDGEEAASAVSTGILAGAFAALDAVNPLVWVGLAAAAIGGLIYWLVKGTTYTNAYAAAAQKAVLSFPVSQAGVDIVRQQADVTANLSLVNKDLADEAPGLNSAWKAVFGTQKQGTETQRELVASSISLFQQRANDRALLPVLANDEKTYNSLLRLTGWNMSYVTQAGITWSQWVSASASQRKQYTIEIQAMIDANKALALGEGREAAARNAQTNDFVTSTLPALQQVTQAEDGLISTILSGRQGFLAFEQTITGVTAKLGTPPGLAAAAKVAGASLNGLNAQSVNLANNFYNDAVPAAQKLIDSLQQQDISTNNLTTAVADEVKQMIPFIGHNTEARSVLVDLINNALGPGTVGMKNLNQWVNNNSGSLKGFNAIIAKSTIDAGNLTGTLKGMTNQMFAQDLLLSAHVNPDIRAWTNAIIANGDQSDAARGARQRLINDLISTGLSAQKARQYVGNLQNQIDILHGRSIGVGVVGAWSVQREANAQAVAHLTQEAKHGYFSTGGKVPGYGGGDIYPALLEPGEVIIDKEKSRKNAWLWGLLGVPGFSRGGVMGMPSIDASTAIAASNAIMNQSVAAAIHSAEAAAKAAQSRVGGGGGGYSGPGGGAPAANAALAYSIYRRNLGPGDWAAWNNVAMRESGWSNVALNSSSGAYGIAQALPASKYPLAGRPPWMGGSSNPTAQITWMWDYMSSVYGGPKGAWAHELSAGWYDNGGWLKPGFTLAYNGTGHHEQVVGPGGSVATNCVLEIKPGANADFDRFMSTWIQKYVRVKGGGDVQVAFGETS